MSPADLHLVLLPGMDGTGELFGPLTRALPDDVAVTIVRFPSDELLSYEELLGIRTMKLRGRVLNRERINKTIEGIYFICAECTKVCHSLDEGIVEDPDNIENVCAEEHRQQCEYGKDAMAL